MIKTLQAALAALTQQDAELTEHWQSALRNYESAKDAEIKARAAMQAVEDVRVTLAEYLAGLTAEGAP